MKGIIKNIAHFLFRIVLIPLFYIHDLVTGKRLILVDLFTSRIGHLSWNTELFLRRMYRDELKTNVKYLFMAGRPFCNDTLLDIIKREVPVIDGRNPFALIIVWILRGAPSGRVVMPMTLSNEYEETTNLPQVLKLNEADIEKGRRLLEKMGIGPNDWYVCFHSRDSKYLNTVFPGSDSSYHDYRDCSIDNYLKAAEYITSLGGYAIRMGSVTEKKIEISNPKIIDYANNFRTDFGDIFLPSTCKFFLGCSAGLFMVSTTFGRPVAGANFSHFEIPPQRGGDVFIPKKFVNRKTQKYLRYIDLVELGAGLWLHSADFEQNNIDVVENSPEEILYLAREMNERLDRNFNYTPIKIERQKKYWGIFNQSHRCFMAKDAPIYLCSSFIEQNVELF